MLQVCYHSVYWVPVEQQETVVVTNGVQTLQEGLLRKAAVAVALYKGLPSLLFAPDISLDLWSGTAAYSSKKETQVAKRVSPSAQYFAMGTYNC